jgi:HAD superfamily hydrolase (TIGR01509 family)
MVLFDVGGVLVKYDQRTFFQTLCDAVGGDSAVDLPWLFDWIVGLRCSDTWPESIEPFATRFWITAEETWDLVVQCYARASARNEDALALLRELSNLGIPCAILSNTNRLHWSWVSQNVPEIALCAPVVLSYEVGHAKPSAQMYETAIEATALASCDIVFVDDDVKNVVAAVEHDIRAIQYCGASTHTLIRELAGI